MKDQSIQEESKKIKLGIMSKLNLRIEPFSEEELHIIEKVELGIASMKEQEEAGAIYKRHEEEAQHQADIVEAYLFQAYNSGHEQLMIH